MVYCMKCGVEIPDGALHCPRCGLEVGCFPKSEGHDYSGVGGVLILAGGILAIVFALIPLLLMQLWIGGFSRLMGGHMMWDRWMMPTAIGGWIIGFMMFGALISLVLGVVAVYSYSKVRRGGLKTGGTVAIVAGILMMVAMNWIPGIMVLIGGVLCHTSR
ncbi:zinc ribbon domain-containing protein [Candidatus Bathyarchaeota archaeon]|nr:zinc ribbon domain-containing protein [Candidatus Bathyarchaeota archaeon]